ncbi:hypothetical protein ACPPTR_00055, partial [Ralstonia pseudosolanacearum]
GRRLTLPDGFFSLEAIMLSAAITPEVELNLSCLSEGPAFRPESSEAYGSWIMKGAIQIGRGAGTVWAVLDALPSHPDAAWSLTLYTRKGTCVGSLWFNAQTHNCQGRLWMISDAYPQLLLHWWFRLPAWIQRLSRLHRAGYELKLMGCYWMDGRITMKPSWE